MLLIGSFFIGFILALLISSIFYINKMHSLKEKIITLRAENITSEKLQEIVKQDFVRLANETIKKEQEDLRKQNRESLEEKILPLTKELSEFKQKVEYFNLSGVENTAKIVTQIGNLEKNNKVIEQETKNLVNALTKNQNIKGAYGEDLLDTLLQSCGMVEGIHYSKQQVASAENLKDGEEHIIRPDVVVNLPNKHHLIIDSKVTLTSYLEYVKDNSKLKEFKAEVKRRIADLSNKNYQNAEDILQPDFVIMYIPIETSLNLLYEDLELINYAYKSNIIIAGTSSLLATIRLVNQLMTQQKLNESMMQIVNAGTNLYETFVQFCEDLIDVQKRFDDVSQKLKTTINRFTRNSKSKPSLFSQVETLKEFGISSAKSVPEKLLGSDCAESEISALDYMEEVLLND